MASAGTFLTALWVTWVQCERRTAACTLYGRAALLVVIEQVTFHHALDPQQLRLMLTIVGQP
jgi:hypothetical protein